MHEVLSRAQVLAPRHLADVDESFNTRSNLDEGSIVSHNDNLALHVVAHLQVLVECIPWVRSELLQAECNALLLVIEVEDNDIDLLVERNHLVRVADASPREVCDVDESVNTAQVDEYAVRSDVLDGSFENLTLFELADDFFLLCFQLSLDERLVGNDNVAELLVDLDDLELHRLAYEYVVVAYRMNVNLATRQEGFDTEDVDNHTALGAALDEALDNFVVVQSLVDALPALAQTSLLVAEYQLTFLVFLVLYIHLYGVAYLQIRIVTELRSRNDTIALVTDVDNNFLLVNADYLTFNNLMVSYFVEGFVVGFFKVFLARSYGCAVLELFPVEVVQRLYVFKVRHKNELIKKIELNKVRLYVTPGLSFCPKWVQRYIIFRIRARIYGRTYWRFMKV